VLSGTGEGGSGNQTVVPFLDQVKVLATGQKVTHDDPAQAAGEHRRVSYSNFTLEVTPTQAARLALATELGKIRAVLRNEQDKQDVDFETVTAGNMLEDIRERQRRVAAARPRSTFSGEYIEYIIGGGVKGGDAVTPAINMPLPGVPAAAAAAPAAAPSTAGMTPQAAQATLQQTLTDLAKISAGNKASSSSFK
jgi:pilus assembly protein CpaB